MMPTWSFSVRYSDEIESGVFQSRTFKAKVRQIRQGEYLLDDYSDYLKQFCLHVPWSNYNILKIYTSFIHIIFFVKDILIYLYI